MASEIFWVKILDNSTGLKVTGRVIYYLYKDNCQDYTRKRKSTNGTHLPRTLLSTADNENFNILSYRIKLTVPLI